MAKFSAKLYIWEGQTLFWGRLPNIEEHSHHALQIEIGLQKAFVIFSGQNRLSCRYAIIPPDVSRRIDDCDHLQTIIYLNPEYRISRILKDKYFQKDEIRKLGFKIILPFIDMLHRIGQESLPCPEVKKLVDDILNSLAGDDTPNKVLDKRIKKVIDICRHTPNKKIPTRILAKKINLSESRLIHLFKEQVGIPIRRYLLWMRLSDALMELSKGGSFTEAAHYAGFADSAHLSRTYRKMYGNSLYNLARNSQFIQAIPCFE